MNDTILLLGSVLGTGLTLLLVLWRIIRALRTDMAAAIAAGRADMKEAIKGLRENDLKHMEARIDRFDQRLTTGFGEVRKEIRGLRAEMGGLRSEVKAEVSDLRTEMGELRAEMGGLRTEVKADIGDLRAEMGGLRTEVKAAIGDLRAEMGGLRTEVSTAIHDTRADMREHQRQVLDAVQAIALAS